MHPYLKIGTKDTNNIALNHQIICLNVTMYAFIFMSIPFVVIIKTNNPILTTIPFLYIPIGIVGLILNKNGFFYLSRWFTIISFMICLDSWCGFLTPKGQSLPNSLYSLHLVLCIIPWFVFSIKEYFQLLCMILISILFTLNLSFFIDKLQVDEVFSTPNEWWFEVMCYLTLVIGNCLLLYVSSILKEDQLDLYTQSLEESNLKNEQLVEKEKFNNENLEKIKLSQIIEQNRIWASDGLSKINEILRNQDQSISDIYNQYLTFTVKYLNANQGGLFLCEDNALHLKACYAFGRKKYLEKVIGYGEGLVGQTYLEGETIILTEIPENYIRITSGLGQTTPRYLILIPIKQNEEIFGILEVASLKILAKHEVEFLEKSCEDLASYVNMFVTKEKTDRLITDLQEQTEEMKSQDEMLRQNMEELSATQEQVEKKQKESENILQRFDLITNTTSEGVWELVIPKSGGINDDTSFWWSDNLRKMLGYTNENDFPNRLDSWTNLLHSDHKESTLAKFDAHLHDLSGNTPYKVEYQLKLKNGTYKWFEAIGNTLRDDKGNPIRVVGSQIDIQAQKENEQFQLGLEQTVSKQTNELELTLAELHNQAELKKKQEEESRKSLEELKFSQIELERMLNEITQIRGQEKQRADAQIATQKQMFEKFFEKTKDNEQKLNAKITELENLNSK